MASEDKETVLYLIQVEYLDKQLESCQLKCDALEKQNKELVSQHQALETERKDITEYLKCSGVAKDKKVGELAAQLESQEQAAQRDQEALKLQHRLQIQQLQERLDTLDSEIRVLAVQFEEQQEQEEQLRRLLSDTESLQEQLDSQQKKHDAAVHRLMMEEDLQRTKVEEQQDGVDDYVKMRTCSVVEEERAQHSERQQEVQLLLNSNMDLWEEKDAVRGRDATLRYETDILKKDVHQVTQENHTRKKEVEQLTKRLQQLEAKLEERSVVHQRLLVEEAAVRRRLAVAIEERHVKAGVVSELEAELQRESGRRTQLEDVMQEAAGALRSTLEGSETRSDSLWTMQRLLEVLESPSPLGTGSALKDSTEETPPTPDPKPDRAETLHLAADPVFLRARYRPGDLGFVPRPTWNHKASSGTSTGL